MKRGLGFQSHGEKGTQRSWGGGGGEREEVFRKNFPTTLYEEKAFEAGGDDGGKAFKKKKKKKKKKKRTPQIYLSFVRGKGRHLWGREEGKEGSAESGKGCRVVVARGVWRWMGGGGRRGKGQASGEDFRDLSQGR